jgi:hypothetical protein
LYTLGRGLQQRENRRKRSMKLGRGEGGWENKIQSKVENAEGKRLMEWIEEIERGMDLYRYQGRNSDRLRNSERRSMGRGRRIQNRRESRVGPSRNSFEEAKGWERTEKEKGGGINKTVYFFALLFYV